jgi:hypothetical protein
MNYPCKDCENRSETCHATCAIYREFRQKNIEINQKRLQENEKYEMSKNGQISRHKRNDKSIFATHKHR